MRGDARRPAIPTRKLNGIRRFGVEEDLCIGCGLCHERAPENFEVPPEKFTSQVTKQPVDSDEEAACLEAEEYCPTGGIHRSPLDSSR